MRSAKAEKKNFAFALAFTIFAAMENVEYIYNSRIRLLRISISATQIRVSVPTGMRLWAAEQFVAEHAKEIEAKQQRLQKRMVTVPIIEPGQPLHTLTFVAEVQPDTSIKSGFFRFSSSRLLFFYSPLLSVSNLQPAFWKGINHFLRKEAKRILPARVAELAALHGFHYTGLKIQSSHSRWGSCSTKKNLNLSFYLLLLPEHLIDYVILHELCHTEEMNHGPRFHELLDQVTGGKDKLLHEELKRYHIPDK